MLTVAICEDEPLLAEKLKQETEAFFKEKPVQASVFLYSSGEELLAAGAADILLMDIRLPGKNGVWIARHFRESGRNIPVIFITSYREYVFQAFDMDAVHYLLKPVKREKLYQALDRALKRTAWEYGDEKALAVAGKEGTSKIRFQEIIYSEVFDHQLSIYTIKGQYKLNGTLDSLEKELDDRFFRCHRSYLVNMDFVTGKKEDYAIVAGGGKVLISRRKQQEFSKRLLSACRKGGI